MGNRTPKCHHCYGFMFVCPSVLYGCLDSVSLGWHGLCPSIRQKLVFCIKTVGTRKKTVLYQGSRSDHPRYHAHSRCIIYYILLYYVLWLDNTYSRSQNRSFGEFDPLPLIENRAFQYPASCGHKPYICSISTSKVNYFKR